MSKLKTVFTFEFLETVRKKSVKVTTLIICMIVLIGTFIPSIAVAFKKDDKGPETPAPAQKSDLGFYFAVDTINKYRLEDYLDEKNLTVYESEEKLKESINSGDIKYGFVLNSLTNYKMVAHDLGLYNVEQARVEGAIKQYAVDERLKVLGIDVNDVHNAYNVTITSDVEVIGKDSSQGFFISYVFMFMMYTLILFFGQTVATSVAREKDSRTMELLITSTKPKTLILGKVFALGTVGIIQMALILITAYIGFVINKGNYPEVILMMMKDSMNLPTLFVYIVFSVVGYMLYLFIFAALGSLVSKVEDVGSSVAPITFLFVAAFLIASISLQMPQSALAKISSFIPFSALFTMPIRYLLTTVPFVQMLISLALMIGTTYLIAKLSIYIYRYGSLNYGNKIKLKEIFSSMNKNKE